MNKLSLLNRLERKRTFQLFLQGKKHRGFGVFIYLLALWGYFWLGGILPLLASTAVLEANDASAGVVSVSSLLSDAGILSSMDVMALVFFFASLILSFTRMRSIYFNDFDQSTLWSLPVDTRILLLSKTTGSAAYSLPLILAFSLPSAILTYVATTSFIKALLVLATFFCADQLGASIGCFLRIATAKGKGFIRLPKGVKTFFQFTLFVLFMLGFYAEIARNFKDFLLFLAFYNRLPQITRPLSYALNLHPWLIVVFVLVTGLVYYAFIAYTSKHFFTIGDSLTPRNTAKAIKADDFRVHKKYVALIRKERQLFFSNRAILFNSFFGIVLPVILAALLFAPPIKDALTAFLERQNFISQDAALFLILIGLAGMMNPSGFGFSLEGLSAYNTFTLPLKGQSIFLGKLCMAMTLISPAMLVTWLFVLINMHPAPIFWPLYLLGPWAYALFVNGISLFFDWKFANYTWTNPEELAKNTKQSFFSGLGTLLVSFAILLIGIGVMTQAPLLYAILLTVIFLAGNGVLYFLTQDLTVYHQ